MKGHVVPRESLYRQFDDIARGRVQGGARAAHQAVIDRLAANQRVAEGAGWTSCSLERAAGLGRLTVWGVPPGQQARQQVPDWMPDTD